MASLQKLVVDIPREFSNQKVRREFYLSDATEMNEAIKYIRQFNSFDPDQQIRIVEQRMVSGHSAEDVKDEIGFEFKRGIEK